MARAVGKHWTVTGREMAEGSDGSGSGIELGQGGGGCGNWSVGRKKKRKYNMIQLMIVIATRE